MAQLRQDYPLFQARGAEILSIGPEGPRAFARYWEENDIPFPGLPDPKHTVADLYGQEVDLLKLGRMPAVFVIDQAGFIRYQHFGTSMSDIPPNREILSLLDELNADTDETRSTEK